MEELNLLEFEWAKNIKENPNSISKRLEDNVQKIFLEVRKLVLLNSEYYQESLRIIPIEGEEITREMSRHLIFIVNGSEKSVKDIRLIFRVSDDENFVIELDEEKVGKISEKSCMAVFIELPQKIVSNFMQNKKWEYEIAFWK